MVDSIEALRAEKFMGFESIRDLTLARCTSVPDAPGVYLVLRDPSVPPKFRVTSQGGHFKGRNPTVPVSELEARWVDGARVLYIGKAGGGGSKSTLRKRLKCYMRFGSGKAVGHWGGRYIWQLEDCDSLSVCWAVADTVDAAVREGELIRAFSALHAKRPFANLRD